MSTQKKKPEFEILDIMPNKITRMGVGYNDNEFLLIMEYNNEIGEEMKNETFAATFPPMYMQELIEALFECGKKYQNEFNKDIGFGDVEEE